MRTRLLRNAPRLGPKLAEEIFTALAEQTLVVTGTNAVGVILPRPATQLAARLKPETGMRPAKSRRQRTGGDS